MSKKTGNVRIASEGQRDDIRLALLRAYDQVKGRMTFERAKRLGSDWGTVVSSLRDLVDPSGLPETRGYHSPYARRIDPHGTYFIAPSAESKEIPTFDQPRVWLRSLRSVACHSCIEPVYADVQQVMRSMYMMKLFTSFTEPCDLVGLAFTWDQIVKFATSYAPEIDDSSQLKMFMLMHEPLCALAELSMSWEPGNQFGVRHLAVKLHRFDASLLSGCGLHTYVVLRSNEEPQTTTR